MLSINVSIGVLTFGKPSECQIIRDGRTVRKRGSRVRAEESRALKFAHSVQLPVPKMHDVRASSSGTEIVVDFVEGECLEEAWPFVDSEQKTSIASQLRDILALMRSAPSYQRKIGGFDGPARDCRVFSDCVGGPFESEAEFDGFVLDLLKGTPVPIRKTLAEALGSSGGHRIVFTHGDLAPRNVIVKEGRVQALLDWEYADWYPEYWECVKFFDRPTGCKDWKDSAEVMLDTPYPTELLTFQALRDRSFVLSGTSYGLPSFL
jgi:tRNA A-37 threonylcarbamoyl transferase component Bud32